MRPSARARINKRRAQKAEVRREHRRENRATSNPDKTVTDLEAVKGIEAIAAWLRRFHA